ncbi:MAG: DUF4133 domain-containing protein [Sphingobacteriaceae bacterium]|nr:MAG: DUF4133 domain-containing protein [Sphingobacteriaceae bacterium]
MQQQEQKAGFLLYKGLKKPLVFKGLKGKYIYQGAGAFIGTLIGSIILSKILGFFFGLIIAIGTGSFMIWNTFRKQRINGLYDKTKNFNEIHIMSNRTKNKKLYEKSKI